MPDCIFCKIANKSISTTFVYENDEFVAFPDLHPKASVHILVIPKKHYDPINLLSSTDNAMLGKLLEVGRIIAAEQGISVSGFRYVINTGPDSGMEISHLHLHVLGGEHLNDIN